MVRLISRQRGDHAALKLTKLFGIDDFPAAKDSGKVFVIIIYCYLIMSSSQRQAIITLIEKKGKDRNYLKNWRPISLTNVDAKIASKVIAARIIPVLPEIVTST